MATISKKFAIKIRNLHQCSNDNRQVCQLWQAQGIIKQRVQKSLRILELFLSITASQVNYTVHFKLEEEGSKDPTQVVRVWLFSQLALRKFLGFLLTRFVNVQNFSLYSSNWKNCLKSKPCFHFVQVIWRILDDKGCSWGCDCAILG